jgi:hypothetical protein
MLLTDTFARRAKYSGAKAGDKHSDGGRLYLLVTAAGKYWRLNYRFLGKQKTLARGVYPAVSLVAARKGRDGACQLLATGVDPSVEKQDAAREAKHAAGALFEQVARDWLKTTSSERGAESQKRVVNWFERDVFPFIRQRKIGSIGFADILDVIKRMHARGVVDSMLRVLGYMSKVFRMAMVADFIEALRVTN